MLEKLKEFLNETKELGMWAVLSIVIVAGAFGVIYSKYTDTEDSAVEELMEEIIQDQVGLDIDLTPSSPEK